MKRVYLFLGAVFLLMNTASLFAYQNEVKIDVWRTSSYEDYCDYEDVDFYLRASQDCYIAVLLVDPDGYANMIYPRPEMPQYRLRHGHRYRLSELMRDDPLYFYGMDGDAFITVIASRAPVYVDRWFIDEFTSFIEYEYGPSITIDLQFGHGFRVAWHKHLLHRGYGVVSVPFMVHHYYHPRRSIYYQSHKPIIHWESRWKYRTPKPVFVKKRDYDRRNQVSNRSKQQYNYDPSSRDRNDRSNKTDWNKRDRTD
ncbi:MAG: DUF4384 domain-containing protein, partial [Deferribacteres bacterium]|nr:DUF4384 domain-containing protein [Deferribacteres bacterium]